MIIRRLIGIALFLPITIAILQFYTLKKDIREGFEYARDEVLLSSDSIPLDKSESFEVTYPYAHGIILRNGKENKENDQADLIVNLPDEKEPIRIVYSEAYENMLSFYTGQFTVRKEKETEEAIEFLAFACGCENIGPSIFYYGSLFFGAFLIPTGLYLTLKKNSNQS